MKDIIRPLRLAVGSHKAGSGAGCAMNVISWENGDTVITDLPGCADGMLARVVQRVNDRHCTHTESVNGVSLLCPPCSVELLGLAHRTAGTVLDWPADQRARLYAEIAVEQAESVLHLAISEAPRRVVELVRRFLAGEPVTIEELNAAATTATDAAAAASADATSAAYAAADAAAAAYAAAIAAADAAIADAGAAIAAANAATANAAGSLVAHAHHLIDRFEELTGVRARPVPDEVTEAAISQMCRVR